MATRGCESDRPQLGAESDGCPCVAPILTVTSAAVTQPGLCCVIVAGFAYRLTARVPSLKHTIKLEKAKAKAVADGMTWGRGADAPEGFKPDPSLAKKAADEAAAVQYTPGYLQPRPGRKGRRGRGPPATRWEGSGRRAGCAFQPRPHPRAAEPPLMSGHRLAALTLLLLLLPAVAAAFLDPDAEARRLRHLTPRRTSASAVARR